MKTTKESLRVTPPISLNSIGLVSSCEDNVVFAISADPDFRLIRIDLDK